MKTGKLICFSVVLSAPSRALTSNQQLVTEVKLNKHLHNTLIALLISIYEFACHYRVLRGTAWAQIDRKTIRVIILTHESISVTIHPKTKKLGNKTYA